MTKALNEQTDLRSYKLEISTNKPKLSYAKTHKNS